MITLSGAAVLVLIAVALLGPADAMGMLRRGFQQMFTGAWSPKMTGAVLIHSAVDYANQNTFVALLGAVATKVAAIQLLPLPWMNGGQAILLIIRALAKVPEKVNTTLVVVGTFFSLTLVVLWMVALAYTVF